MANKTIVIDTSILIDYYRKTDKEKSIWIKLIREGYDFAISSITKYEVYSGAMPSQLDFWNKVIANMEIIALDESCIDVAVEINAGLKRKRKQIEIADLFIAATAVSRGLPLATLNKKHFERIEVLKIIE
jgi:predicted nucleic acid-binding protein